MIHVKKENNPFLYLFFLYILFFFTGCQHEEIPSPLPKVYFHGYKKTITENANGSYNIIVMLSKPAEYPVKVHYTVSGTATENEDYVFVNRDIEFMEGDSVRYFIFKSMHDSRDEWNEDIVITLTEVENDIAIIDTTRNTYTVEIRDSNRSDLNILLRFGPGRYYKDVLDMDMILWRESSPNTDTFEMVATSAYRNTEDTYAHRGENILLSGLEKDGLYALSYIYYEGTYDSLNFRVIFSTSEESTIMGNRETVLQFEENLSLKNINKWDVTKKFHRAQYFRKTGFNYTDFTQITISKEGS